MSAAQAAAVSHGALEWRVRFVHPEKATELARLSVGESDVAPIVADALGIAVAELEARRAEAREQVRASARLLLEDREVRAACAHLPFRPGQTIVALGDSLTDDALSWAHQLNALLEEVYPDDSPAVVNAGRSGDTTADVIDRLDLVLAQEPDWVIQLLGTNDVRHHGGRRVFSPGQTGTNFDTIQHVLVTLGGTRLIRMTPPPVAAPAVEAATAAPGVRLRWQQEDLARVGRHLMRSDATVIDLHAPLLPHARALLDPDGLHPHIVGHRAILRVFLLSVAALPWSGGDDVNDLPTAVVGHHEGGSS